MSTLKKSLVVKAALAGLVGAAFSLPAMAEDAPKTNDAAPAAPKAAAPQKGGEKIHCPGVNACKGKSECSVDGKSSCSGQNACKGQGWISLTKKECKKASGKAKKAPAKAPATPATPAAN